MCFFKKRKAKKEAKRQAELEALKANEKKAIEDEKKVPKVEEKKVEVKKEEPKVVETKDDDKDSNKVVKYHVSQNKDDKSPNFKQWRVRKQGSQKTIKYFNTQLEAIEFAEDLAEKAGSSIVIHKVDGSIRKQDYTKK
ncbi:DUF2188 domain-containing protein [Haploplasma axanthum]|uniref:DUF2188 domain-containing protein n=1 Tax=Haploplasma axanthum TaxID=29552 RepID=A0A449BCW9_HAPAX|nr:DUF2188 domain-containing protein [Haploplasma axanthum]VEU80267.1 Uncharacterised protein [Haploplasma axanthum]